MGQAPAQTGDGANMASNSEYLFDLDDLDKSDIFDPGSFAFQNKDFSSCFPQESKKLVLIFALNNYNISDVVSRH